MIEKFITKNDKNGNRYTLEIDHGRKTYKADYNPFGHYDGKTVTKRERKEMIAFCEKYGFTRIF